MCFNDRTIVVPRSECPALLEEGATCGSCDERCCPEQLGDKIDMCLRGKTINVSRDACPGLIRAGATCGPCEDDVVEEVELADIEVKPRKTKSKRAAKD